MSATRTTASDLVAAHRGKLVTAAALLALVAGGAGLRGLGHGGLVRALFGQGYLPWVTPEWKARQAAIDLGWPLARLTVDPRHPAAGRLERLAREPDVERLAERFVWLRDALPPGEGPPPAPVLVVRTADGERDLAGPWTIEETLAAPLLIEWLRAGHEAHARDEGS